MSHSDVSRSAERGGSRDQWHLGRTELLAIVAFWAIVGLLSVVQSSFDPRYGEPSSIWTVESAHRTIVFVLWCLLTPVIFWFSSRFSPERVDWRKFAFVYFVVGIMLSVAFHLFLHVLWNVMMPASDARPLSVGYVMQGLHFLPEFLVFLLVLAAGFARDYAVRYRERVLEAARLRAEATDLQTRLRAKDAELKAHAAEARLQALRTQVNPHFLFNTLNAVATLADDDPKAVSRVVNRLGEILRYTLSHTEDTEVSLRKELTFMDRFLEIQQVRFGQRLTVRRAIDPMVLDACVPSFVLQAVLEHAIEYGVDPMDGRIKIEISAWRENGDLCLAVHDQVAASGVSDGPTYDDAAPSSDLRPPLARTQRRLQSLYGKERGLVFECLESGGHRTVIRLPFRMQEAVLPDGDGNTRAL